MLSIEQPSDMDVYIGQVFGPSEWLEVTQEMIDRFAEATGDRQWIHIDVERATREMPGGKTVAHGYLTLSLLPKLTQTVVMVRNRSRSTNYGLNKVRFISPVPSGARIRLREILKACEPIKGGRKLTYEVTIEIEGSSRPVLVAETISLVFS
jgi:acyl dehydratase